MILPRGQFPSNRIVAKLRGSCLCQAITWELDSVYISQLCICHCGSCQRHSGSFHIPFAAVERHRLWPLIQDQPTLQSYQSSVGATRYFCGTCASPIVHDYHEEHHTLWIPMGTLIDDGNIESLLLFDTTRDSHIFCNDQASYESSVHKLLPRCNDFGLYKQDPCQPNKDWEEIPIMEMTVQWVDDEGQSISNNQETK